MKLVINTRDLRTNTNSILFAVLLSFDQIGSILKLHFNIESGLMMLIAVPWVFIFFFNNFSSLNILVEHPNKLICLFLFTFVLVFSIVVNGEEAFRYFFYFVLLAVPAYMISCVNYKTSVILESCIGIYALYLLVYFFEFRSTFISTSAHWQKQMNVSYELVQIIITNILYTKYAKKKVRKILAMVELMASLVFIVLDCTTRGAFICLIVLVLSLLIMNTNSTQKIKLVLAIGFPCVLFLIFSNEILELIFNYFAAKGIYIGVIYKFFNQASSSAGFYTGRSLLYRQALDMFLESPIIGQGVGAFENTRNYLTGWQYVHQHILQIMCETGIGGLALHLMATTKPLMDMFRHKISGLNDEYLIGLILFCISIPRLMVSNVYWITNSYWLLLFWLLSRKYLTSKKTALGC